MDEGNVLKIYLDFSKSISEGFSLKAINKITANSKLEVWLKDGNK